MNEHTPFDDLKAESSRQGRDPKTRSVLVGLLILWLVTLAALLGVTWRAYFQEKEESRTLAQQISMACLEGDFGPDFSVEDEEALCSNAERVIENDPELQEDEIQEAERQESEIQEREVQDPEFQDPELKDDELQESEIQDSEVDDPEIQDDEIQNEEIQDPEINDPDPNDQIRSGSCTFDGTGTIVLVFETTSGPVTTTCTGTGTPPGRRN